MGGAAGVGAEPSGMGSLPLWKTPRRAPTWATELRGPEEGPCGPAGVQTPETRATSVRWGKALGLRRFVVTSRTDQDRDAAMARVTDGQSPVQTGPRLPPSARVPRCGFRARVKVLLGDSTCLSSAQWILFPKTTNLGKHENTIPPFFS